MTYRSSIICSAIIGALAFSFPVHAQQKTAKACQEEWRANKADNQAKGVTEKAYVTQCRSGGVTAQPAAPSAASSSPKAATTTPAASPAAAAPSAKTEKTVKACQEEWRANKADNQAKGVTEKAYVTQCRSGGVTAQPAAPSPASSSSQSTTAPAAPAATTAAKPATQQRGTPATAAPAGDNQYVAEAQAKARCPSDTVVWVNLSSKIYHFSGHKDYGHTKSGAYMCEKDAVGQGLRASKAEKRT